MDPVVGFVAAALRIATPLGWAALGEVVAERSGVINLSVEGSMLAGCLAAAVGAATTGSPWLGLVMGVMAGALVAAAFAAVSIWGRTDQIIAGTAMTLAAIGITGVVFRQLVGFDPDGPLAGSVPTLAAAYVPTILLVAAGVATWWMLFRTTAGLRLRAVGEAPLAAGAIGIRVRWIQAAAVIIGGAMAGLGGATLVLAQVGAFAERMTAGRGFIAIAIVVLGRWHPLGILAAALVFGVASASQFVLQPLGLTIPYQVFLGLPYLLALLALTGVVGRARSPASLGRVVD